MGLNQADSMAVMNIVVSGIAILGYMMMSASSGGQNSITANRNHTAANRNSVGGKTRRRR